MLVLLLVVEGEEEDNDADDDDSEDDDDPVAFANKFGRGDGNLHTTYVTTYSATKQGEGEVCICMSDVDLHII